MNDTQSHLVANLSNELRAALREWSTATDGGLMSITAINNFIAGWILDNNLELKKREEK